MKKLTLLFLSALWISSLSAQTKIPMEAAVRYGKLPNGMTYYIRHNDLPSERVNFYIAYNVGSILEEDNEQGLAHFLEHMAFNGSKNFPGRRGVDNYLQSIGLKRGVNLNANTSWDRTNYFITNVPTIRPSIIDSCLLILHDWSGFISLDNEAIDKERKIILEEWRTKNRSLLKENYEQLYPGSQYAKRVTIGDTTIIKNFTYDELHAFYKKWYRPDLEALIIVGDINVDQIEADIKRIFADIPKPVNPAERIIYKVPDNKEPIISIITNPETRVTNLSLFYKHKPLPDSVRLSEEGYDITLVNSLISSMLQGHFSRMQGDPGCPFTSQGGYYTNLTKSIDAFAFTAVAKEGSERLALETLLQEAQRTKRYGFTQAELDRAKIKLLAGYEKSYNERDKRRNSSYAAEYIRNFYEAEPIPGMEWEYSYIQKALAEKINLTMVNKIAKSYVTTDNIIVSINAPEKVKDKLPSRADITEMVEDADHNYVEPYKDRKIDKPLLKKKPKAGSIVKETQNEQYGTTEWTLSNGIRVILKPTTFRNDEINLYAFGDGGLSVVSTKDLPSASLANGIVSGGNLGGLSLYERGRILSGKIVNMGNGISDYTKGMSGRSSVKDAEAMFQLLYLRFTDVSVNKKSYENYMQKLKSNYANKEDSPSADFNDTIASVQGNYNPRRILMNTETLNKVSASKAYSIYKDAFKNPADFTFILTGNINLDSIKPLITTYLGGLKTSSKYQTWKDDGIRYPKGNIKKHWSREMQVPKTSVYLTYMANIPYNFENIVTITALSDILEIHYTETLREEEGGTYGVSVSDRTANRPTEQTRIGIKFNTTPDKADYLIDIAKKELDKIVANGVREKDLNKVKKNLLKNFTEGQKSNSWWENNIYAYEKSGFNWLADYERIVNNLSTESLQKMLQTILSQGNSVEYVMSPAKK